MGGFYIILIANSVEALHLNMIDFNDFQAIYLIRQSVPQTADASSKTAGCI